jgi:hypothetical protein
MADEQGGAGILQLRSVDLVSHANKVPGGNLEVGEEGQVLFGMVHCR